VAIDLLGVMIIGLCAVLTITTRRTWYLDIGLGAAELYCSSGAEQAPGRQGLRCLTSWVLFVSR
jgi:hypothetical protein